MQRYPSNEKPNPILEPRKEIEWEGKAVFNPTIIKDGEIFRMLYRTYPSKLEMAASRLKRPGFYFKNQISYIGYAESEDGINFERRELPFISPDTDYDRYGCEDPRMTKLGDIFYITYTAINDPIEDREHRPNVRIALASTKDFKSVTKHGIIGPSMRSKAAALFPEPVNGGKIALLLTISPDSTTSRVSVRYYDSMDQVSHSSFEEWDKYLEQDKIVLQTEWWLHRGPEVGAVPIKTEKGWLLIFSGESMSDTWTITAALLDAEKPDQLIARVPGYLLQAVASYERNGLVPNVTFPEGAVIVGDDLYVYYGAADTVIGLATCKLKDLLDYLEKCKK